jgi:hypothetical protein
MTQQEVRPQRDQPVLTMIAVSATLLALPVILLAGEFRIVMLPGIVLAAALVAAGRDTAHALAGLLIVALLWLLSDPDPVTPWSVALAILMLTSHSAVALRSSLPPGAPIGSALARRWLGRGAVVGGLTVLVYLAGLAVHHLNRGDSEVVVVLALCLVGGLVLLLRSETLHNRP